MDDDVVWLADGALEAMLEEKLRGKYLYVSANVINHSSMGLVRHTPSLLCSLGRCSCLRVRRSARPYPALSLVILT